MPLFGPFVDKQGPVISAAFCNALDVIQNALSVDVNGGATFAAPTTAEPTIIVNTFPGTSPGIVVNGGGVVVGSASGGVILTQDPSGLADFNNQANQGYSLTGGPVLATSVISTAIGSAGGGLTPANAFQLETGSTANARFLYRNREVGNITPTGTWTLDAPSSTGPTLVVNGGSTTGSNFTLQIQGPTTLNKSFGLNINAGTGSNDVALNIQNANFTQGLWFIRGNGQIFSQGPFAFSQSLGALEATADFGTFNGGLTGFNGSVSGTFAFWRMGPFVTIMCLGTLTGQSSGSSMTLTGVPSVLSAGHSQTVPVHGVVDQSVTCLGCVTISLLSFNFFQYAVSGSRLIAAGFNGGNQIKGLASNAYFTYELP